MLHHCISSMLSCNQNSHCVQGPKSDYTHAYNHPLLNLSYYQAPLWSFSVFSLLLFLFFIPLQLFLAKQWHTIGTFRKLWLPCQNTLQITKSTLYRLKQKILFVFLLPIWSWGRLPGRLASVGAKCFTTTLILCCLASLFATVVALPTEFPLRHAQFHRRITRPILL